MGLKIRVVDANDSERIKPLMLEYICDFYHCPRPDDSHLDALIRQLAEKKVGQQWLAMDGEKPVGFATVYFTVSTLSARPALILHDLFVQADYRGQKIGEALFKACNLFKVDQGFSFMQWDTARDNVSAQKFYERLGGKTGDWILYTI